MPLSSPIAKTYQKHQPMIRPACHTQNAACLSLAIVCFRVLSAITLLAIALLTLPFPTLAFAQTAPAQANLTQAASDKAEAKNAASENSQEWSYIDNGQIKVGIKRSSGAAISWVSRGNSDQNLVNHFDRGRLIQQSYYGDADGSRWDKQPWHWNPVQGGHYLGRGAPVNELKVSDKQIYAKSTPLHWATGELLTDCTMEQTITLHDQVAQVHYRFAYAGNHTHAIRDQEVPAVFLEPEYKHLVLYSGDQPWRAGELDAKLESTVPGWPNESRKITEHWAAYVDDSGFGLGAYVPAASQLTCYRFGDGRRDHGACSYFAPLVRFAIKPGFTWEYDLYLTVGSQSEIRSRFYEVHQQREKSSSRILESAKESATK